MLFPQLDKLRTTMTSLDGDGDGAHRIGPLLRFDARSPEVLETVTRLLIERTAAIAAAWDAEDPWYADREVIDLIALADILAEYRRGDDVETVAGPYHRHQADCCTVCGQAPDELWRVSFRRRDPNGDATVNEWRCVEHVPTRTIESIMREHTPAVVR